MTRIAIISDTHSYHSQVQVPDADILVHCGDFSGRGTYADALKFVNWLGSQPHKHKVFIAGNHDLYLEQGEPIGLNQFLVTLPSDVYYLNDSGVNLQGIKFWGSPVQPRFFNWAFNRDRGDDIRRHWDMIPADTDFLVTHGPPKDVLDSTQPTAFYMPERVGCADLALAIDRVRPKVHAFGHIHYSYGWLYNNGIYHFNASCCNEEYQPVNKPFLIDLEGSHVEVIQYL